MAGNDQSYYASSSSESNPVSPYVFTVASAPVAPICVLGSRYCTPNLLDLAITRQVMHMTLGNFEVADANDNVLFKVSSKLWRLHDRRLILDKDDKPIANLREKIMSAHHKWEAFRGEGSEPSDLIFSAQMSKLFQVKTELNVFLANNNKELAVCDFKVKGSWAERSCTVYAGESSTIIAQVHAQESDVKSVLFAKDKYMVTVYPNVDFAFIVALMIILDGINTDKL